MSNNNEKFSDPLNDDQKNSCRKESDEFFSSFEKTKQPEKKDLQANIDIEENIHVDNEITVEHGFSGESIIFRVNEIYETINNLFSANAEEKPIDHYMTYAIVSEVIQQRKKQSSDSYPIASQFDKIIDHILDYYHKELSWVIYSEHELFSISMEDDNEYQALIDSHEKKIDDLLSAFKDDQLFNNSGEILQVTNHRFKY
jgi:hypothetical protein